MIVIPSTLLGTLHQVSTEWRRVERFEQFRQHLLHELYTTVISSQSVDKKLLFEWYPDPIVYKVSCPQDMHNRKCCTHRSDADRGGICLGCEMDFLFAQVFSGVRTPYSPHHFLYSVWKYSNYFAGYEQQDAHEFLISTLNAIHSHCDGTPFLVSADYLGTTKECRCIIHETFNGVLRSDVTCCKCGHVSTSFDPFFDISLDLPKPKKRFSPSQTGKTLPNIEDDAEAEPETLFTCLDRYVLGLLINH